MLAKFGYAGGTPPSTYAGGSPPTQAALQNLPTFKTPLEVVDIREILAANPIKDQLQPRGYGFELPEPLNICFDQAYDTVRNKYKRVSSDDLNGTLLDSGDLGYRWDPQYNERKAAANEKAAERYSRAIYDFVNNTGRLAYEMDNGQSVTQLSKPADASLRNQFLSVTVHFPED